MQSPKLSEASCRPRPKRSRHAEQRTRSRARGTAGEQSPDLDVLDVQGHDFLRGRQVLPIYRTCWPSADSKDRRTAGQCRADRWEIPRGQMPEGFDAIVTSGPVALVDDAEDVPLRIRQHDEVR